MSDDVLKGYDLSKLVTTSNLTAGYNTQKFQEQTNSGLEAIQRHYQKEEERKDRAEKTSAETLGEIKELNRKLSTIGSTLDLMVNKIGAESQINQQELRKIQELMIKFKETETDASDEEEKDGKLRKVLMAALDNGKQIAIPLLVEYIKYQAKAHGFPIEPVKKSL